MRGSSDRDTDAGGHRHCGRRQHERCRHRAHHPVGEQLCLLRLVDTGPDHDEFIAGETGDGVAGAGVLVQAAGYGPEQLVAG